MSEQVRIVKLEAMRVASAHAYSVSPEQEAWDKLIAWAKPKGLLDDPDTHRIFGFNNPDPSPGSPNYGYEFWIIVGPEVEPEGEIKIKDFSGGLYAVARCDVQGNPGEVIPSTWNELIVWGKENNYKRAHHQWLEEHIGPADEPIDEEGFVLDLYMPIME
jgi:DNA gyrase inhibitor GyrI